MGRKSATAGAEFVQHIVGIRTRVTGIGTLTFGLESFNAVNTQLLDPITLQAQTAIEPTKLANFQSQRVRWTLTNDTTDCGKFQISRIIIFTKAVAMEYPM